MTRDEWFKKAARLIFWVGVYNLPELNKEAEQEFLAHVKTDCPEE